MYGTKARKTEHVDLGSAGNFTEHPGALHVALHIPLDRKIGAERIDEALHSRNPRIRRMAASAKGFEGMRHK
jgi:hypothetical protein